MITQRLQAKTLELRKSRDPLAPMLVAVWSRAQALAKADNPQNSTVSDDHALRAIRNGIKVAEENVALLMTKSPGNPAIIASQMEIQLLSQLLPQQASQDAMIAAIREFRDQRAADADDRKIIGDAMAFLKQRFGATLNAGAASALVRQELVH